MSMGAAPDRPERFKLPAAVSLLLVHDGKILLCRRKDTGWQDGKYGFMAGHIDGGESFTATLCREAMEELGITVEPRDVRFAHLQHNTVDGEYVYVFFVAEKWQGEPRIREPHKCDNIRWFPMDKLPDDLVYGTADVIGHYLAGVFYSESGFN